ncbi:MAG: hypothetical protein HYS13_08140 [Planctomycetia bacterium]|nr:hypothetical protein [Planctomycetia bacterium]
MDYAHRALGLGAEKPSEPLPSQAAEPEAGAEKKPGPEQTKKPAPEQTKKPAPEQTKKPKQEPLAKPEQEESDKEAGRHVSGQQLCEAIRIYALEQFGYLAKPVLNSWGIRSTSDFGEMVYNLIAIGQMRKTKDDRREDFDNVFDFDQGLRESFSIHVPPGE